MPRNYKRKTQPKYDLDKLNCALERIKKGDSVYSASKTFGIAESTLRNRLKRKTKDNIQGAGRKQLISEEIEAELASNIEYLVDLQQPMTKAEILHIVQEYFEVKEIPNPFSKNNKAPGREWLDGFFKRFPQLVKRKAQGIQKARVQSATTEAFTKFFEMLGTKVNELNITNPAQIINLDETGYSSSLTGTVIAKKGTKCVSQVHGGSGKETFSVVETVAANGHLFPPLIIYKSKNLYSSWCVNGPKDSGYLSSENGWQDKNTFFYYFKKLMEWTNDWPKPILIVYDGHKSHIQYRVSEMAIKNKVHILSLPAHSSDKLQPLDVGVFGPVKKAWLRVKRNYARKTSFKSITKEDFPSLMKELRDQGAFKEHNIKAGFKSSGIWPVNLAVALRKLPPQLDAPPTPTPAQVIGLSDVQSPDDSPLQSPPATDDQLPLGLSGTPVAEDQQLSGLSGTGTSAADDHLPSGLLGTPVIEDQPLLGLSGSGTSAADDQLLLPTTPVISLPESPSPSAKLTHQLPNTPTFSDLASFRKLLLQAIVPRKEREKVKRKKLTFNNMVLTQDEVMKQMEEEENKIKSKEKNKQERKRKREENRKEKEAKKEEKKKMKEVNKKRKKVSRPKKAVDFTPVTSSEEEDFDFISDKSDDDLAQLLIEDSDDEINFDINQPSTSGEPIKQHTPTLNLKKGDHVAACYDNQWFIAKVIGTSSFTNQPGAITYYHLEYAQSKGANKFIWPEKVDEVPTLLEDILCVIDDPKPVSSRHIGLNSEDLKKVTKLYYSYLNRDCSSSD